MAYTIKNNKKKSVTDFDVKSPYSVLITFEAYLKLKAYIQNVTQEVGGLGAVMVDKEQKQMTVYDIFLIEQEVSAASTDLSPQGMARFYTERKQANPDDDFSAYKLWWHSHASMDVFWSGTDNTTIESLNQEIAEDNWLLSIVGNHKDEFLVRLDVYEPVRMSWNHVPFFYEDIPKELTAQVMDEIEDKVTVNEPVQKQMSLDTTHYEDDNGVWKPRKTNHLEDYEDEDLFLTSEEIVAEVIEEERKKGGLNG